MIECGHTKTSSTRKTGLVRGGGELGLVEGVRSLDFSGGGPSEGLEWRDVSELPHKETQWCGDHELRQYHLQWNITIIDDCTEKESDLSRNRPSRVVKTYPRVISYSEVFPYSNSYTTYSVSELYSPPHTYLELLLSDVTSLVLPCTYSLSPPYPIPVTTHLS